MLGKQSALLSVAAPGADLDRRRVFVHNVVQEMQEFHAVSAAQEEARQKILSFAYGMQLTLAEKADEPRHRDEAFEKLRQQAFPLAMARLRAFHPTFLSDLADLWVVVKTRPAAWVAEQKPLELRFEANAETETWQGRLAVFDQLGDIAVTAKWATEYTDLVAEFLREDLLDLSVAEGRNEARRLLQRCATMWTLAAQKQALSPQEQALVLEVQRALRRLDEG